MAQAVHVDQHRGGAGGHRAGQASGVGMSDEVDGEQVSAVSVLGVVNASK